MAEIELFHYHYSESLLNRTDTRIKLLSLLALTISIFHSQKLSLSILSIFTLTVFLMEYYQSKCLSPGRLLKIIRSFLLFLIAITLARSITIEGSPVSFIPLLSKEGLYSGLIYSWKLVLVIILSQTFTSTTDPAMIHGAIYKLLNRIPFLKAGIIATMMTLTIGFIPLIFDQYLEVCNARDSRLGNETKNPIKKISSITLPLLQTTISRADEVALAMESRCYNNNPTLPDMVFQKKDYMISALLIVFLFIIFLLNI